MSDPFTNNLTTLARRLRPFFLGAVRAAPGVAAVMLNRILLIPAGMGDPGVYDKSAAGLASALAAAVSGDAVWLPPCALGGSQSVPAGVSLVGVSRGRCVIAGQVTLGDGSKIEHLSITYAGSVGVAGPAAGAATILGCDITTTSAGDTAGVEVDDGDLEIWDTRISAVSASADGYGLLGGDGSIYMDGGWLYGSSAAAYKLFEGTPERVALSQVYPDTLGKTWNFTTHGAPSGWTAPGFDDAGWNVPWRETSGSWPLVDGTEWILDSETLHQGDETGYRYTFTLDAVPSYYVRLSIFADDAVDGVWINGQLVWGPFTYCIIDPGNNMLSGWQPVQVFDIPPHYFQAGSNCIAIKYHNETMAEYGTTHLLSYALDLLVAEVPDLVTNGVRMAAPLGEPAPGDRAAWDAIVYQDRHANDIDEWSGVHHTLGTGASQAAAGDHTHAHLALTGIDTDESATAIHHTLGTDEFQAAAGDHDHGLPAWHHETHEDGGNDEINVSGLAGVLTDAQNADHIRGVTVEAGAPADGDILVYDDTASAWQYQDRVTLTVKEVDGSPSDLHVEEIRVTNGRMTAVSPGVVELDISGSGGGALDDLSDVDIPTPSDGDVLTYHSGSGHWEADAPSGGPGSVDGELAAMNLLGWA